MHVKLRFFPNWFLASERDWRKCKLSQNYRELHDKTEHILLVKTLKHIPVNSKFKIYMSLSSTTYTNYIDGKFLCREIFSDTIYLLSLATIWLQITNPVWKNNGPFHGTDFILTICANIFPTAINICTFEKSAILHCFKKVTILWPKYIFLNLVHDNVLKR